MVRTQISIREDQKRRLDAMAARTGLPMSALVRQAIGTRYPEVRDNEADIRAIERARGAWRNRDFDGESYVERLRPARRSAR